MSEIEQVIYVECGTTLSTEFTTGIQRVVKNLLGELKKISPSLNVKVIPVMFTGEDIIHVAASKAGDSKNSGLLFKFVKKLDRALIFSPMTKSYHLLLKVRNRIRTRDIKEHHHSIFYKEIEKNAGESLPPILLLLDSSWYMDLFPLLDRFRKQGGRVSSILYDLIPFSHPDTVEEVTRVAHTNWWLKAPGYIDSVICISKTVREQFIAWQETNELIKKIPLHNIRYFYLGADLSGEGGESHFLSVLLRSDIPFYTMIGSIEPRKNHSLVLDAFDSLWEKGQMARLVIVGRHGWHSDEFIQRMTEHKEFNVNLFYFKNACDVTLMTLYINTKSVIMASMEEGFGLPIVEALRNGAKVICNDIPVFREVGEGIADVQFFTENSSIDLFNVLESHVATVEKETVQKELIHWISWEESASQLLQSLKDIHK